MKKKRGYSRAFPSTATKRVTLMVDHIPPDVKKAAKAKAKRDGVSLRSLILRWLTNWSAGRQPHEDAAA